MSRGRSMTTDLLTPSAMGCDPASLAATWMVCVGDVVERRRCPRWRRGAEPRHADQDARERCRCAGRCPCRHGRCSSARSMAVPEGADAEAHRIDGPASLSLLASPPSAERLRSRGCCAASAKWCRADATAPASRPAAASARASRSFRARPWCRLFSSIV